MKINLKEQNTKEPKGWDKEEVKEENKALLQQIYTLQRKLYAEGKRSLLIVMQGMDAAGKDGLTRNLFALASPAWTEVQSFKKPTERESAHHYLWRISKALPKRGNIGVFNRSHYEDILVPSVYGYIDKKAIQKRYEQINNFEKLLVEEGTEVLKFYLNVSFEKQEEKLIERTKNPSKFWKHSDGDWETREYWDDFMKVYESIFDKCDTVPWHIIPSDKNWVKLNVAAKLVLKKLKEMDPKLPKLDSQRFNK